MIKELDLKNFKCFQEINLKFSMVNILTGLNGMGKSTVIQSILLLGQSAKSITSEKRLSLSGEYVNLGVGKDVLYEKAEEDEIGITVGADGHRTEFVFDYQPDTDYLPLKSSRKEKISQSDGQRHALFYLSAYRIEPQLLYRIGNENELAERYFGKNGEYAIQYLKLHGEEEVQNRQVLIGDEKKSTIANQVKEWLDMISPGVSPVINVDISSRTAELKYEYIEDREKTNSYKSINVGFGITYVLPVVVALVASKPGDIILIENPEAHIHPKGQRMLGELMAAAGAGGVQIITETHSDHVLNGIRVAVKRRRLETEKTGIFFFYKDREEGFRHKVLNLRMDQNGRIDEWPEGFFDEWDNALLELL